jgi:hypothetical protein
MGARAGPDRTCPCASRVRARRRGDESVAAELGAPKAAQGSEGVDDCFDALSATFAADKSEIAASLISAAEILREEGGVTAGSLSQKWNPVTWETLRNRLSERSLARSIERGRAMDLETAVAFALASTD